MEIYKLLDEEVDLAREAMKLHRTMTRHELVNGESVGERLDAIEAHEQVIREMRMEVRDSITRIENKARGLETAKENQHRIMAINRETLEFMDQDQERVENELDS